MTYYHSYKFLDNSWQAPSFQFILLSQIINLGIHSGNFRVHISHRFLLIIALGPVIVVNCIPATL
jgi:hypothetical protein